MVKELSPISEAVMNALENPTVREDPENQRWVISITPRSVSGVERVFEEFTARFGSDLHKPSSHEGNLMATMKRLTEADQRRTEALNQVLHSVAQTPIKK